MTASIKRNKVYGKEEGQQAQKKQNVKEIEKRDNTKETEGASDSMEGEQARKKRMEGKNS